MDDAGVAGPFGLAISTSIATFPAAGARLCEHVRLMLRISVLQDTHTPIQTIKKHTFGSWLILTPWAWGATWNCSLQFRPNFIDRKCRCSIGLFLRRERFQAFPASACSCLNIAIGAVGYGDEGKFRSSCSEQKQSGAEGAPCLIRGPGVARRGASGCGGRPVAQSLPEVVEQQWASSHPRRSVRAIVAFWLHRPWNFVLSMGRRTRVGRPHAGAYPPAQIQHFPRPARTAAEPGRLI